jgi:hypothetical protein
MSTETQVRCGRRLLTSGFRAGRLRISVLRDLRSTGRIQRPIWVDVIGVFRWVQRPIRVDMRLGLVGPIRGGIRTGHGCA